MFPDSNGALGENYVLNWSPGWSKTDFLRSKESLKIDQSARTGEKLITDNLEAKHPMVVENFLPRRNPWHSRSCDIHPLTSAIQQNVIDCAAVLKHSVTCATSAGRRTPHQYRFSPAACHLLPDVIDFPSQVHAEAPLAMQIKIHPLPLSPPLPRRRLLILWSLPRKNNEHFSVQSLYNFVLLNLSKSVPGFTLGKHNAGQNSVWKFTPSILTYCKIALLCGTRRNDS